MHFHLPVRSLAEEDYMNYVARLALEAYLSDRASQVCQHLVGFMEEWIWRRKVKVTWNSIYVLAKLGGSVKRVRYPAVCEGLAAYYLLDKADPVKALEELRFCKYRLKKADFRQIAVNFLKGLAVNPSAFNLKALEMWGELFKYRDKTNYWRLPQMIAYLAGKPVGEAVEPPSESYHTLVQDLRMLADLAEELISGVNGRYDPRGVSLALKVIANIAEDIIDDVPPDHLQEELYDHLVVFYHPDWFEFLPLADLVVALAEHGQVSEAARLLAKAKKLAPPLLAYTLIEVAAKLKARRRLDVAERLSVEARSLELLILLKRLDNAEGFSADLATPSHIPSS